MASRVAAAGMALAAAVTLAGCHEARGGGYIGQVVPQTLQTPSSTQEQTSASPSSATMESRARSRITTPAQVLASAASCSRTSGFTGP